MNRKYPVMLDLRGRACVVVGGGAVALRKVEGLLECTESVRVVSPSIHPGLAALVQAGRVEYLARAYAPGDLRGVFLVVAATDDPDTNEAVWQEAEALGVLVNTVDDPPRCSFYVPAVVRRGALTLAISTDGKNCALAAALRRELEERFGPEYGPLLDLLGELRDRIRREERDPSRRKALAERLATAGLDRLVACEGLPAARRRAEELVAQRGATA